MNIGFHFQGQFCIAEMQGGQVKNVRVDETELNILPEMLPVIMQEYRGIQAGMN